MPNDGSLEALPVSPCTSGSEGMDHHFLGTVPLKVVGNHSPSLLNESHNIQAEEKVVVIEVHEKIKEKNDTVMDEKEHTGNIEHERSEHEREHEHEEKHKEEVKQEGYEEERENEATHTEPEAVKKEDIKEVTHDTHDAVEALTEKTLELTVASTNSLVATVEKMASGVPERPVKSGMPSFAATRGLSAASLALKQKKAAESALAATKATAATIPETESISDRIKMFGGSNPGRITFPVMRKLGVRDIVQKYKDVEDLSNEEIAHVAKGHDARGVHNAFALSTASRHPNQFRSAPRRKMSHELSEHGAQGIAKATGYSHTSEEEDRVGVSQESVQSVRNAKSLFENLARSEGAQQ